MSGVSIVEAIANETVVVSHVEVGSIAIVFPVSDTVANHETLEVGSPSVGIALLGSVNPSVDSQSELRNIDTGIGLT